VSSIQRFGESAIEAVEESVHLVEPTPQYGGSSHPLMVAVLCSSMDVAVWRFELVGDLGDLLAQQPHEHPSLLHASILGHFGILPPEAVPRAADIGRRRGKAQLNTG
jgi:hypothetical protein